MKKAARHPLCASLAAVLTACGAGGGAGKDAGTALRPDAGTTRNAGSGTDDDAGRARARCVPRNAHTYVGFSAGMTLDDFELAAYEAERILAMIERELCSRANALAPNGTLAAGLSARRLELFEVLFVRDDASAADVGLRALDDTTPHSSTGYRIAVERTNDEWAIVAVTLP
ncbi:MAG: hypothetical protein ACHQ53_14900 [Polyangiales bacterium]